MPILKSARHEPIYFEEHLDDGAKVSMNEKEARARLLPLRQ